MATAWPCSKQQALQAVLALCLVCLACLLCVLHFYVFWKHTSVTLPDDVGIDDVIRGDWNYDPGPLRFLPVSCRPQHDVVFVKCVQCSTDWLDMIFRRHGYLHNLSVVLPVGQRSHLGWPYPMTARDYRPPGRGFNLLAEQAVYNGTSMRLLMNKGAVFFTVIRQPLDTFVSALQHFRVMEAVNITGKHGVEAVREFLANIRAYDNVYKSHTVALQRPCIPGGYSLSQNPLSKCLGMPLGFPEGRQDITDDLDAVRRYIQQLDSEFLLVMIREHLDESLVLLKRLMCWEFKDIMYLNSQEDAHLGNDTLQGLTHEDRERHRRWSAADYLLYDHFNTTLWRTVEAHGSDFWEDLLHFRELRRQVTWFCRVVTPYGESYIQLPETVSAPAFRVSSEDCRLMEAPLLDMLKERHGQLEPGDATAGDVGDSSKLC